MTIEIKNTTSPALKSKGDNMKENVFKLATTDLERLKQIQDSMESMIRGWGEFDPYLQDKLGHIIIDMQTLQSTMKRSICWWKSMANEGGE